MGSVWQEINSSVYCYVDFLNIVKHVRYFGKSSNFFNILSFNLLEQSKSEYSMQNAESQLLNFKVSLIFL